MDNVLSVKILNPIYNLLEQFASLWFLYSPLAYNIVKELSSTCIFHYEVKLTLCLYDVVELHYVRVTNHLKYLDLSCYSLYICHVCDSVLLQDLDRHLLSSQEVLSQLDFTESTFSYRIT